MMENTSDSTPSPSPTPLPSPPPQQQPPPTTAESTSSSSSSSAAAGELLLEQQEHLKNDELIDRIHKGSWRSVKVVISNFTGVRMLMKKQHLRQGKWTVRPPRCIVPGETIFFGSHSTWMFAGTWGDVQYSSDDSHHRFRFYWQCPLIESVKCSANCFDSAVFKVSKTFNSAPNASVHFVISAEGAPYDLSTKAIKDDVNEPKYPTVHNQIQSSSFAISYEEVQTRYSSMYGPLPKLFHDEDLPSQTNLVPSLGSLFDSVSNSQAASGFQCSERDDVCNSRAAGSLRNSQASASSHEDNDERDLCIICMEKPCDCVILRCGHVAVCYDCGKKLTTCCMCREHVSEIVKIYKN